MYQTINSWALKISYILPQPVALSLPSNLIYFPKSAHQMEHQ
uniref:Uncharacterized protein n=1 Tax=Rhizophora mucronata TaxID=61149 RepID=A0A2P2NAC7_RHIMU